MTQKPTISVKIATIEDAEGILNALKQDLIEIRDVDELSQKQIKKLEEKGFLRKEVELDYYQDLIKDPDVDIYIAKIQSGKIVGFVSIHNKKYNIVKVRDVIGNLTFENQKSNDLLLNKETRFAYLDQVSILPEYKRKGIATAIFQEALLKLKTPVVAFIVEKPIFNKASVYWHENNGFEFSAISDGNYKGKDFKFQIFIHWNKK
ncbi:MAG: GNAT family N-acetyltransferase [Promethearchaeota archaeon]|jgi:ribosomal protein S18 acetylase RimI-like enzyme